MSEGCEACARIFENIPIVGHLVAMVHSCAKKRAHAERASIKATLGICLCICNFPTEAIDECIRIKSSKLVSYALTTRPEWMKRYHRYNLKQICLPGSHQSATYHIEEKLKPIPMCTGWSICQDLDIRAQLRGGIRFLDLRIMSDDHGEIWTHHNVVRCVNLRSILTTVRDFINSHPSEIVGMSIVGDGKHVDWPVCKSLLNEYIGSRLIDNNMRNMVIYDIVDQGKNVFVTGIPGAAYSWSVDYHWPNKEWVSELRADLESTISELAATPPDTTYWYKAECTPGPYMIMRGVGGVPGAAVHKSADEKYEFLEDASCAVNHMIYDTIKDIDRLPFHIFSMDFVQDEVVDRIIELNGFYSEHDETIMLSSPSSQDLLAASNSMEDFLDTAESVQVHLMNPNQKRVSSNSGAATSRYDSNVSFSQQQRRPNARNSSNNARSSNSLNITGGSTISAGFEMVQQKAPALEVKETTM